MHIDLTNLSTNKIYYILTQAIIPRPVAWVLSENESGSYNLAPFSYFNGVCSNPPLIMLSVGKKADGTFKDTRVNIEKRKDFVVHIPNRQLASAVTETSRDMLAGESELDLLNLDLIEFPGSRLPRIAQCPVAFHCVVHSVQEIGDTPQAMILGEIKNVYIDDTIGTIDAQGHLRIDPKKLDPIARLGGDLYATLGDLINIPRPR